MGKVKTTRDQQPISVAPLLNSDKAAKGYPAVTRFAQAPAPSTSGGNGLPHQLQQGVEALSGMSMAGTSVHYNSPAPAQIGALAYARGNQIHLGPGQELHLPHEAWHVVQQKQGRVKPTLQAKGLALNDDQALETEADIMGHRAAQLKTIGNLLSTASTLPISQPTNVVQRMVGFEFQAVNSIFLAGVDSGKTKQGIHKDENFKVEGDGGSKKGNGELELETKAVDETGKGRKELGDIMDEIKLFLNQVKDGVPLGDIGKITWTSNVVDQTLFYHEEKKKLDIDLRVYEAKEGESIIETQEKEAKQTERKRTFEDTIKEVPRFSINKEKHFHPQATVGIKFDKIAELIDYVTRAPIKKRGMEMPGPETKGMAREDVVVTGPSASHPKEVKAMARGSAGEILDPQTAVNIFGWGAKKYHVPYKSAWRAALEAVNDIKEITSPRVKGLAAIFYGLAKNQSEAIGNPKHLKYMMPFMLRNGFMPFFNSLKPEEKIQLKLIDLKALDVKIMPPGNDEFKEEEIPTVKEIFEHMLGKRKPPTDDDDDEHDDKKDYLQQKWEDMSGHGGIIDYKESYIRYGMKRVDDIGSIPGEEVRRGAIIELRKLGSEVLPEQLKDFALAVFDLVSLINATGEVEPVTSESIAPTPTPPTHVPEPAIEQIPPELADIARTIAEVVGELPAEVPLPLMPTGPPQQDDAEAESALPLPEPIAELLPLGAEAQPDVHLDGLYDMELPPAPPPPTPPIV